MTGKPFTGGRADSLGPLRRLLLALAAGLALADTSIVTLALPDLLVELRTTIEGVAAVIGVYTVVLAAALVPAERLARRHGADRVAAGGLLVFAAGCLISGLAGSLGVLLVGRGVQALGGAAALVCGFALLVGRVEPGQPRRLWLGASVLAAAAGPALGGALTQLLSWEAIFLVQAPVALAAAAAAGGFAVGGGTGEPSRRELPARPALALGLVSAALSAVLFLLVLLLVAGWSVSPLGAAAAVLVIPLAALAGARLPGEARVRAAAGCLLVAGGTVALALLPGAAVGWTLLPQAVAGVGMGLALPSLGGELLPERDAGDAARLLTLRHAGIVVALVVLAPVVSQRLENATQRARERGVALVLDARLDPQRKLELAPALLAGVDERDPRGALQASLAARRSAFEGADRARFDELARRADETLTIAVAEAFDLAFVLTGILALLAALAVAPRPPGRALLAALGAAVGLTVGYGVAQAAVGPEPVALRDPCQDRPLPGTGGISGFVQDRALELLDTTACRLGSSREELVLALASPEDARRFEQRHGVDPRSATGLLGGLLGGG